MIIYILIFIINFYTIHLAFQKFSKIFEIFEIFENFFLYLINKNKNKCILLQLTQKITNH
jgi:hypothetical protein